MRTDDKIPPLIEAVYDICINAYICSLSLYNDIVAYEITLILCHASA